MASSAALDLIINLQTDANNQLDAIAKSVARVGTEAEKVGGTSGGFLSRAFEFATGGAILGGIQQVGGALVDMFTGGFADARQTQQLMAQTQAVITSTGGAAGVTAQQVADLATSLSDASGKSLFGDDQIQAAENYLLTFTNVKGSILAGATQIAADMAQALGTEPQAQAIALGKALNDPVAGISALTRVGVTFTDQQKAQIAAMQEAGNTAGAQQVILTELGTEFGGSALAAAQATGGFAQFKAVIGEAAENVGAALLPAFSQLTALLSSPAATEAINAIATALGAGLSAAMTWLTTTGIPALTTAWQTVQPVLAVVASAIGDGLSAAMTWLSTTAIPALIGAWQTLQPAMQAVIGFITGTLLPGLQTLVAWFTAAGPSALQSYSGIFATVWTGVQAIVNAVVPAILAIITTVFGAIASFLQQNSGSIQALLSQAWSTIQTVVQAAVAIIQNVIVPTFQAIAGFIAAHKETIVAVLNAAWQVISSVISATLSIIQGVITAVMQAVQGDWSGAWETIKTTAATVWENIKQAVQGGVDLVKNLLSLGWDAVQATVSGIWNGIKGAITGPIEAAQGVVSSVIGAIQGFIQSGIDKVNALINAINSIPGVPNIPGFADGVRNFGGGLAMVGERGPELVYLPRGSDVYSNQQSRALGSTTIINVDARGSQLSKTEIQAAVEAALQAAGRRSDTRIRTT